jgi:hypothetical protein
VKFVDLVDAVQIQPDHDRGRVAAIGSIFSVRKKQPARASGDTSQAYSVLGPVEAESEFVAIVFDGTIKVDDGNFRNWAGKMIAHGVG